MFNNFWLGRVARVLQAERGQIWTGRTFKLSKHRWQVLANYLLLTAAAMTMSDCCAIMRDGT
jgi:hypothetical protein